jgi:hypothetical protein
VSETSEAVRAAATLILDAALRVLDGDGHQWSSRPYETCRFISSLYEKPFGCSRVAMEREARVAAQEARSRGT